MTRKYPLILLLALLVQVLLILPSFGGDIDGKIKIPDDGNYQKITLADGSVLFGRITNIDNLDIVFVTGIDIKIIKIEQIRDIEEVADLSFREAKYWFPNPNRSRLYFAQTGRMLKGGAGYFSDIYCFFPGFTFGLTDNITIGGGMSLFPGVKFNEQLYYITPKIGFKTGRYTDLAVSALIFRIPEYKRGDGFSGLKDGSYTFGIIDMVGTIGTDEFSVTGGLGYGFAEGERSDELAMILGCELRIARSLSIVSENWNIPGLHVPIISYGIRMISKDISVDFAFLGAIDNGIGFFGIPYFDLTWNF